MPHFSEEKIIPYSAAEIFAVVADVASYPEFLPWCRGARVYNKKEASFDADVMIGLKLFRERFTSRVLLVEDQSIEVDYIRGPLKRLYNHWKFEAQEDGACLIDFEVDFEFKNKMLEEMMSGLFEKACHKMMVAFEARVASLSQETKTQ